MKKQTAVNYDPFRDGELFISVPTTESQKEIWSSIEIDPDANLCYNESIRIKIEGNLDRSILEKAINEVIKRHDALRSTFSPRGKDLLVSNYSFKALDFVDFSSETDKEQKLNSLITESTKFKFDLVHGDLFKCSLYKFNTNTFYLFITAHHLICDGWSIAVIVNEMSKFYEALRQNKPLDNSLPKQLHEYALENKNTKVEQYWIEEFSTLPKTLDLPTDLPRPDFRRYESHRIDYQIDPVVISEAKKNAAKNRKSFYQYLLSAFDVLIYKLSQQEDFVIGISSAAQSASGLNDLVGHLVNLLPIRTKINDSMTFEEHLNITKTKMLDAFDHQTSTFGQILNSLNIKRDPSRIPLVNIIFNVDQQYPGQGFEFTDLKAEYESNPRHYENFEIFINATTLADKCIVECQYNIHLFKAQTISNWLKNLEEILRIVNSNTQIQISEINLNNLFKPKTNKEFKESKSKEITIDTDSLNSMRNIWEEILGVKGIPDNANFFSIGGHSLLGVDICHLVQERLKVKLTLKDLIKNPELDSFSTLISKVSDAPNLIDYVKVNEKEYDLTINQKQSWYLEQLNPGTSMHNLPSAIRIKKSINFKKLKESYLKIIENHPALRTCFVQGPRQKIISMDQVESNFTLDYAEMGLGEIINEMNSFGETSLDISSAPLIKAKLYKIADDDYVIFTMFHHIIFDGWCFDIFFQELTDVYEGKKQQSEGLSYFDFAHWQNNYLESELYSNQLEVLKNKLSGKLPVLDLPLDYPRPAVINHEGGTYPFSLNEELVEKMRSYAKKYNFSMFTLFLGTFKKALMHYSSSDEVIVGIPVRARNDNRLLNTIGYFVNSCAIRTKNYNSTNKFFQIIHEEVADALTYQDVPFERVIKSLTLERDTSRTAIFQSFFSYQDVENRKAMFDGVSYTQVNVVKSSTHTDIDLWIKSSSRKIEGAFEFRKDLFKQETIETFYKYFLDLLNFILLDTGSWDGFFSKSVDERIKVINNTHTDVLPTKTIADYVDTYASTTPQKIALIDSEVSITYSELKNKSDAVAASLINDGLKPNDLVGICSKRDVNMLISLIGIMKAGAGYVPLDPYFPTDRLDYMIEHSKLTHLICNKEFKTKFDQHNIDFINIEDVDWNLKLNQNVEIKSDQSIYVIYTSGSTGKPKGVNLSYGSVLNFIESMKKEPGMNSSDRLLAVTTLSFDIAVLELYVPLISGGSVFIASKEQTIDGDALKEIIENNNISIMQATPSTWRLLLSAGWKGNQNFKILCGGEPFPKDLAKDLIPKVKEVWNMYGPTETTVWSTIKKLTSTDGPILIGKPIDNTSVYILDEQKNPVPFGAVGELYIGGDGLALGYIHRKDLTDEKFVKDKFKNKGKMYQTGDLARFHQNGEIECLGRNDGQVKVRGYRIELGEIESILHDHPNTQQAVVMVREDRPGDVRLVGYLKLSDKNQFDQFSLREFLGSKLPPYMLPSNYILMDDFPQTLNGKIDKKSLPSLSTSPSDTSTTTSSNQIKEIDEVELRFSKIWLKVLGVDSYTRTDNFFDVGGHSLLSVDLFSQLAKEFNVELKLASLIENNTFEQILNLVRGENKVSPITNIHSSSNLEIPNICNSLVSIKKSGHKTPIYCFHGVGGNILNYMRLAPACGDHPLIGVQAQGVDGKSLPLQSINEMVNKYLDEIRLVQPRGPYLLAGASMGGIIAIEVANKLKSSGETVAGVILLDTFGPNINIENYSSQENWFAAKWTSLKWKLKKYWISLRATFLTIQGKPLPHSIRYFKIETMNYKAIWSHSVSKYNGDIHIIRAPIKDNSWYSDPKMGWKGHIQGDIITTIINGDHEDFVEADELPEAFKNVLHNL